MENGKLAHYTSLDALFGIIKEDGLHFRATRYDKLNDTQEYKWLCKPLLKKVAREKSVSEEELNKDYGKFPYVVSFSQEEDNHLLWHLYGGCGRGVSLVLDMHMVSQHYNNSTDWDVFQKMRYANEENKMRELENAATEFRKLKRWQADESENFDDEFYTCAFVKNEGWEYEKELRYARVRENIISVSSKNNNIMVSHTEDKHDLRYYARGTQIIPYLDIAFEPQTLLKIIVGNNLDFHDVSYKIKCLLQELGNEYKDVQIEPSKVIF